MRKAIAAAAFMSLMMCSAASANTISSATSDGGLKAVAASEVIQVGGRGGSGRGMSSRGGARGMSAMRGRSYSAGSRGYHRGHRGRGYGYGGGGYGYGGDWGYGTCGWVGPLWVCP